MNKMSLIYTIKNGEAEITGCNKDVTEVVIPSEIDGCPVKRISDRAFMECPKLAKVKIEKGLRVIGYKAFFQCLELTTIEIPNTVIKISDLAFGWCPKIKRVDFQVPNKECHVNCTAGLPLRKCVDGNWR